MVWIRDVGILYTRAVIQRTIDVSPAFLEHGSAEKITVGAQQSVFEQAGGLEAFLYLSAQKNQKSIAVDSLFKAYPMILLSCRSNLAFKLKLFWIT